jgi:formamidopyrimidine-DNA glycosylase
MRGCPRGAREVAALVLRGVPELPEVEITRRQIAPLLVGRKVRRVHTTRPSYLFLTRPERLRRALTGRTVTALARRGKYLVADLDDAARLVVHLGMTGQLFGSSARSPRLLSAAQRGSLAPEEQASFRPDAHTHLRLEFEDGGAEVYLRDVRKFGKVLWLRAGERHERLELLGVDALDVTGALLFEGTRGRKAAIKSALLDQSLLAGVGNIYADEALFLSRVRPSRRAGQVTRRECDLLAESLLRVLRRSIETGGSSISDYVAPDGADGAYQSERRVYARDGEPCGVCETKIRRSVVGQRGTHYCPRCQT